MKLKVPQLGKKKKKLTRRDDAESIVGKDLAKKIEAANSRLGVRSYHAMVEMSDALPYGGAITLEEVQAYLNRTKARGNVLDALQGFTAIVQNVLERDDITDKQAALENAVTDFRNAISAEKMLSVLRRSGVQVGKSISTSARDFLYPKTLSAKSAVAKSLGIKPKHEVRPLGIKQIVRSSVGLNDFDRRKALGARVHAQIVRGMGIDLPVINEGSVKNIVRKNSGLQPVAENESKPKSVRQVARQSVGLQ